MAELDAEMDFASMKVNDLKKELKARGLSVTGNKNELIERLQMSMMGTNESDILADASDLLEGDDDDDDDDVGEDSVGLDTKPEPKKVEVPKANEASKKKVAIKRDSALPVVAAPEPKAVAKPVTAPPVAVEAEKPEAAKPAPAAVVAVDEKPAEQEPKSQKAIKEMTDAERAAIRAAKFGGTASVASEDKKLARAQRFGLPVTAGAASNGKASKIGDAPVADLETLKKRAERFGQTTSNIVKKVELDEKIKKRQERFGEVKNGDSVAKKIKIEVNKSLVEPKVDPDMAEKLKKRAERFGAAASL